MRLLLELAGDLEGPLGRRWRRFGSTNTARREQHEGCQCQPVMRFQDHEISVADLAENGNLLGDQPSLYYVVAERREQAGWVKNLKASPLVTFSVGSREAPASVVPPSPAMARIMDRAVFPELSAAVAKAMDAKYHWSDGLIVELTPISAAGS